MLPMRAVEAEPAEDLPMMHFNDPAAMPGTGEGPAERFASAGGLHGTAAVAYLQKRHVPLDVAEAADVRFDADFAGRAAVVVALNSQPL